MTSTGAPEPDPAHDCQHPKREDVPAYRAPRLQVLGEVRGATFGGSVGASEAGAGIGGFFLG